MKRDPTLDQKPAVKEIEGSGLYASTIVAATDC